MSTSSQKKKSERNGNSKKSAPASVWNRALTPCSKWPDKDEFLDIIYWSRQVLGIIVGIIWGLIPLKGLVAIILFCIVNTVVIYVYSNTFQKIDEEEFGGAWELIKEGFMTSFAGFLVSWVIIYSAIHYE